MSKYLVENLDRRTHTIGYYAFMGIPGYTETENVKLAKLDLKKDK